MKGIENNLQSQKILLQLILTFPITVRDVVRNDGSVIGLYHRVDHEGFRGTVKFIGTLPDTTGI